MGVALLWRHLERHGVCSSLVFDRISGRNQILKLLQNRVIAIDLAIWIVEASQSRDLRGSGLDWVNAAQQLCLDRVSMLVYEQRMQQVRNHIKQKCVGLDLTFLCVAVFAPLCCNKFVGQVQLKQPSCGYRDKQTTMPKHGVWLTNMHILARLRGCAYCLASAWENEY